MVKEIAQGSYTRMGFDHGQNNPCFVPCFGHEMPKVVVVSQIIRKGEKAANFVERVTLDCHWCAKSVGRLFYLTRDEHLRGERRIDHQRFDTCRERCPNLPTIGAGDQSDV